MSHALHFKVIPWNCIAYSTLVPEVFLDFSLLLIFLCMRELRESREAVENAKRWERKTSGYLGLESHFHADASCQTGQIYNFKGDQ